MKTIELYLPWPPTINDYYGHRAMKRRIIPFIKAKGKAYRKAVEDTIFEQVGYLELADKLHVEVVLHPPDARRRDLDNYMKGLLDALTHAKVWEDDSQIDQLPIYRGQKITNGLVIVRIDLAGPVLPPPVF